MRTAHNSHDLTGQRFGHLVAVRRVGRYGEKVGHIKSLWLFRCDCGVEKSLVPGNVKRRAKASCGCKTRELSRASRDTHGLSGAPEHRIWKTIKTRCLNPNAQSFKYYGARGITICREWRDDFRAFLAHIGPRPTPNHSVDRIDNSRGYEPGNVRWATSAQQNANTRRVISVELNGMRVTLKEYCQRAGINYHTTHSRIHALGWSFERAVSTPPQGSQS